MENNENQKVIEDDGKYKKTVKLDDGTKLEIIAEKDEEEHFFTKNEIYKDIQAVEERLCGTENLTVHADKIDYLVSSGCGIICGFVDSFFVGEFNIDVAISKDRLNIDDFIIKAAKKLLKYKNKGGDPLKGSIKSFEDNFKVAQDNAFSKDISVSTFSHHLDDLAHHPSPLGLIAGIFAQYLRIGIFTNKDGETSIVAVKTKSNELIKIWLPIIISGILTWIVNLAESYKKSDEDELPAFLQSTISKLAQLPQLVSVLKTVVNWAGHLVSDVNGSSSTPGEGMGIPGLYLSFLKEVASLPGLNNTGLSEYIDELYQNEKFDLRKELSNIDQLKKQFVPVVLGEALVRGFYLIRHFVDSYKENNGFTGINWRQVVPVGNRTIVRMLTVEKGTFEVFDVADAAIRSGGFTTPSFLFHLNFVGATSFAVTLCVDVRMGFQKLQKEHKYDSPINLKLIKLYKKNSQGLSNLFNSDQEIATYKGPLFLHIDEKRYSYAQLKIMYVDSNNHMSLSYSEAKQTSKGLLTLFEETKSFRFSSTKRIGKLVNCLSKTFDKNGMHSEYIWDSIYKFNNKSDSFVKLENINFNLLAEEIEICKPDVLIFLTDKNKDSLLNKKFINSLSFQNICCNSNNKKLKNLNSDIFAKVRSTKFSLPEHTYRITSTCNFLFWITKKKQTILWLLKLLLNIEPNIKEKNKNVISNKTFPWKTILSVLLVIILLFLILLLPKKCNTKQPIEEKQTIEQPVKEERIEHVHKTPLILTETKSFEFRADRRDYVDYNDAMEWCDSVSNIILDILKDNPEHKFLITGYAANFNNEIDSDVLALERADNIKKELVNRGIPEDLLSTISGGTTSRWGIERNANRAVTIKSIEQ